MIRNVALFIALLLASAFVVMAQNPAPAPRRPVSESNPNRQEPEDHGLPEEMRSRLAIERANIEHRKLLDNARQLGDLSTELAKQYGDTSKLTDEDFKKLASIEKLARKIINQEGGEEVDNKAGDKAPTSLADAIDQLTTMAALVKKDVLAQSRLVVSASVIANSNEIVHLAEYIRRGQR